MILIKIIRGFISALRPLLSRFLRRSLPQLVVLSNLELSDNRHIRMTAIIGGK
ncbi:flagellar biosynthesis FlhA domain protein [Escherichia sp. M593]|nr:flagellar biosynthesis FlhA domain protein [Escherichia sp. M593]